MAKTDSFSFRLDNPEMIEILKKLTGKSIGAQAILEVIQHYLTCSVSSVYSEHGRIFWTTDEVAALINETPRNVRNRCKAGLLKAEKLNPKNKKDKWLIYAYQFEHLIKAAKPSVTHG